MTVKLADTRELTLDDAKETLRQLAEISCKVEALKARKNLMIHRIKAETDEKTKSLQAVVPELKKKLAAFIMGHQDLFKSPRAIQTDFGKFGLRRCGNKLEIDDPEAVIKFAKDNGYDDLVIVTKEIDSEAVKRHLKDGDEIPGCSLPGGEAAFYTVSKALLDDSKKPVDDSV